MLRASPAPAPRRPARTGRGALLGVADESMAGPATVTAKAATELLRSSFERAPTTGGLHTFREALRPPSVSERDVATRHERGDTALRPTA